MKALILVAALLCASSVLVAGKKDKCYALVLSTGGDKGAYQAGAIQGLVEATKGNGVQWDVITGIGAGALNAAIVGAYPQGQESAMAKGLHDIWYHIKGHQDIYHHWTWGYISGMYHKNGLYNTKPLRKLLEKHVNCQWHRAVTVVTTNLDEGLADSWDVDQMNTCSEQIDVLMGSSAMATYFPYQVIQDATHIDGGVLVNLDVGDAVKRCMDIVDKEEDIVIDIIQTQPHKLRKVDAKKYKAWEMGLRYLEVSSYRDNNDDLIHAEEDYPNIQFRYVVTPTQELPSSNVPLGFGEHGIKEMLKIGKSDATKAVNHNGSTFKEAVANARAANKELRKIKYEL